MEEFAACLPSCTDFLLSPMLFIYFAPFRNFPSILLILPDYSFVLLSERLAGLVVLGGSGGVGGAHPHQHSHLLHGAALPDRPPHLQRPPPEDDE